METGENVRKSLDWGYMLEAPGRPKLKEQQEFMRAAGVSMAQYGPLFHDQIERGSTRPRKQLIDRATLLLAVFPGDTVHIAAEFCLGVSTTDARWFIHELIGRGANLRVADKDVKTRAQNTANVAAHRKRKRST